MEGFELFVRVMTLFLCSLRNPSKLPNSPLASFKMNAGSNVVPTLTELVGFQLE